jgi:hypothetical protein
MVEPGFHLRAGPDVEQGMIRLPNRIRSLCLTAMNQVESGAIGLVSFMRQSQEARVRQGSMDGLSGFFYRSAQRW